jgi:hypothetical protein
MRQINSIFLTCSVLLIIGYSCKKSNNSPQADKPGLSYGDSVFYLRAQAGDLIVTPKNTVTGQYTGFPDGIVLDGNTGAVNVSKSETGLRYKITFVPDNGGDTLTSIITISGINFMDGFYNLAAGDSIVHPVYNGRRSEPVPGLNSGSLFDIGNSCNQQGCTVDVSDGQINLAQTVRNGVFGATPSNNDRHEFLLNYRINDNSQEAANSLNVKIYYFDSINDVTQEVYDILTSRQGTIIESASQPVVNVPAGAVRRIVAFSALGQIAKANPRPPCIFIIAR